MQLLANKQNSIVVSIPGPSGGFYMTEEAFNKAINAKNKELFLINGATHIETYWKSEYVQQAISKLVIFYENNLLNN